ncbi:MAG: glycine--tRNA ligase subunit beta, partial [Fusobacterium sp.]
LYLTSSEELFKNSGDLKKPFENNIEKLKTVVYQKDLGTIYSKMERVSKIADLLIEKLGYEADKENIKRTIALCKADLVSNMINEKEFTELQGFMGADYALKNGEKETVAKGIEEHYFPRFKGDNLPTTKEGIITGMCDRLDTLVGCLGVGVAVTGSKDPFALRRAALAIVNVILNSKLDVSLKELVEKSIEVLDEARVLKKDQKELEKEVLDFLKQRVVNVFTDLGYRRDVILAVVKKSWNNVVDTEERIKVITEEMKDSKFKNIISIIKRVGNIVKSHKDKEVKEELFKEKVENELYNFVNGLAISLETKLANKDYRGYLEVVLSGEEIINEYFDNVMVNDKNEEIKMNRLSQLKKIDVIFKEMAELNLIEA